MRLIVCLFIFFFSQISSSQEIVKDSVRINEKKNINYKEEIKKFRDSISEKNYPIILYKEYSKLDSNLIIDNTDNLDKLYKLLTCFSLKSVLLKCLHFLDTNQNFSTY